MTPPPRPLGSGLLYGSSGASQLVAAALYLYAYYALNGASTLRKSCQILHFTYVIRH